MIFVDVGAHEGQTLEEAVRYDFEHIYAFEPMPAQHAKLVERFGDRENVTILGFGLADSDGPRLVYGNNDEMEASIYADKEDVDAEVTTKCDFMEASAFFGAECPDRGAFLKLNCEGSEIPILNNLIDTGAIGKVRSALVDFDSGHITGMGGAEAKVRERLHLNGYAGVLTTSADAVPRGWERRAEGTYRYTRRDEIMCWLKSHGIAER